MLCVLNVRFGVLMASCHTKHWLTAACPMQIKVLEQLEHAATGGTVAACPPAKNSNGEAGHRSQCLSHAKRALYHLSYIPIDDSNFW